MHSRHLPPLVLTAHDIFSGAAPLSWVEANVAVGVDVLIEALGHLEARGYKFVPFAEFIERRQDGGVALLTFDDAYGSVSRVALPVLRAHGLPAVVFVVAGTTLGNADPFPIWLFVLRDKRSLLEKAVAARLLTHRHVARVVAKSGLSSLTELLSQPLAIVVGAFRAALHQANLDELAEIVAICLGRVTMTGPEIQKLMRLSFIELGAHSVTHRSFSLLNNQEIEAEVARSVAAVAELCGKPSSSLPFAYPYGAVTPHAVQYVSRTCRAGFTCHGRPITAWDSAATLPRINLDGNAMRNAKKGSPAAHILCLAEKMRLCLHACMLKPAPGSRLSESIDHR